MNTEATDQTPLSPPMLRIEAGQHIATIKRLDLDREEHLLVTGSDDKTARVWALPEGRLVRVLRPPAGLGDEGKVYAVALSPDGRTVAVGGWDVELQTSGSSVYIFDCETGRVLRRLGGLDSVVFHLAFAPGGDYLAATLGKGVRVWETRDWAEVFADRDYGESSYGLSFAQAGQLATTCWDGLLRIYEPQKDGGFSLPHKVPAPGGAQPYAIAFSPNSEQLAVGYSDTPAVSVLSGATFASHFSVDTSDINTGVLACVAWSADGQFLYAGGQYPLSGESEIVRWGDAGRGRRTAFAASKNTIQDLKPWGRAGVLFASQDPSFGGFDENGKRHLYRGPENADLRSTRGDAFTVSRDGRSVRFGLQVWEARPVRFDLAHRQVTQDAPAEAALAPPQTTAKGLLIEGWENTAEPRLNGEPLELSKYEVARSLAIEPGARRFLLGTEWWLRLFDKKGAELWQQEVPSVVWGVNIPRDGKLALAAYGDGTIRWHRLRDGEELLALFVHPDARRWIAWTPQGYYDAAAGADGLIGWHVNRGRDEAADFFPVGQFRQRFYRPDVVSRVLDTLDVNTAVRQADDAAERPPKPVADAMTKSLMPPAIELLAPHDGAPFDRPELTLTYLLRNAASGTAEMSALVDGRPERVSPRTVSRTEEAEVCQVTLQLPPRDSNLGLTVRNADLEGRSGTIRLRWVGEAVEPKPTLYLLAVGVSKYERYPPLTYADRDAKDFKDVMHKQERLMYEKVEARTLFNEGATRFEIMDGLQWLMQVPTKRDIAMVFLSGHGLSDERRKYYFLPYDFDLAKKVATGVKQSDLTDTLREIPAKKVLFFVDSCHSAGAGDTHFKGAQQADIDGMVNELKSAEAGVVVFASSTGTQLSREDKQWENGAFTEALLEGLAGKAAYNQEKAITIKGLDFYLARRVKELTGGAQTPTTTMPEATPDFPIAAVT